MDTAIQPVTLRATAAAESLRAVPTAQTLSVSAVYNLSEAGRKALLLAGGDPTDPSQSGLFRGFILRNSDVGAAALTLDVFLFRVVCGNHIIWGLQHVAGFRRRHVGTSIQDAWSSSLASVHTALDADPADDRAMLLRATSQEIAPTRDGVLDAVTQRLDLPQKSAAEAYSLAEQHERNPRSVWGYVQGLTRLSQRTPWQDGRFTLDRAASRLLTTVH